MAISLRHSKSSAIVSLRARSSCWLSHRRPQIQLSRSGAERGLDDDPSERIQARVFAATLWAAGARSCFQGADPLNCWSNVVLAWDAGRAGAPRCVSTMR